MRCTAEEEGGNPGGGNCPAGEEKRQRPCAEKNPRETVCAKDGELQALRSEHARLRKEPDAQRAEPVNVAG